MKTEQETSQGGADEAEAHQGGADEAKAHQGGAGTAETYDTDRLPLTTTTVPG